MLLASLLAAAAGSPVSVEERFSDVQWHCHFIGPEGRATEVSGKATSATTYNSIGFLMISSGDGDLPEGDHPLNMSIRGEGFLGIDLDFPEQGDLRNHLAMMFLKDGSGFARLSVTQQPSDPDFSRTQVAVLKVGYCRWEAIA